MFNQIEILFIKRDKFSSFLQNLITRLNNKIICKNISFRIAGRRLLRHFRSQYFVYLEMVQVRSGAFLKYRGNRKSQKHT